MPGKPGLSTVCPTCGGPKKIDPRAVRAADRQRRRELFQAALRGKVKAKAEAIAQGKLGTAEEHETEIVKLRKILGLG